MPSSAAASAALRSARRSSSAHTPSAAAYRPQMGTASRIIETASGVGVAKAANTKMSSTAQRQPRAHVRARTRRSAVSATIASGSRAATPKASISCMTNDR